jgi:hypothetical protein
MALAGSLEVVDFNTGVSQAIRIQPRAIPQNLILADREDGWRNTAH